jgi:hypothetical protein
MVEGFCVVWLMTKHFLTQVDGAREFYGCNSPQLADGPKSINRLDVLVLH